VYLDGVHWKIVLKIEERMSDMVRQLEQDRKQEMLLTKRKFDKLSLQRQELATQLETQVKKIKTRATPQQIIHRSDRATLQDEIQ
jgi:hypothetical protein